MEEFIYKLAKAWKRHMEKFDPAYGSPYPIIVLIVVMLIIIMAVR